MTTQSARPLFNLLGSKEVHAKAGQKIIPASNYAELIELAEVKIALEEEVHAYKAELDHKTEEIREEARQKGFERGMAEWTQQLALLQKELDNCHNRAEKQILPVALKVARKILDRELELSDTVISDIIASSLKAVSEHRQITIFVSPDDYEQVEKQTSRFRENFSRLESLSVRSREDLKKNTAIIETEAGIIQVDLEKQWELIEKAFKQAFEGERSQKRAETHPEIEQ